ncbi:MAG: KTSC domain-containing protein [Parvibaculaceae bacterium]
MTQPATFRGQVIVAVALAVAGCAPSAGREPVVATNRGAVDLAPFECQNNTRSGFITRVCYEHSNRRLLLGFQDGTYRLYCGVDASIANGLLSAPSMARFYSTRIRGTGKNGPFDCGARR